MRDIHVNVDATLNLSDLQPDVATGIAKMEGVEGGYVRLIHVVAANEFTVPLTHETPAEDALRLAAATTEWDVGMMEQAEAPFSDAGPKLSIRQTIRNYLPCN